MARGLMGVACSSAAIAGLGAGSAPAGPGQPRVTNRCPTDALPLRRSDLPALRRFGLTLAPHGVERVGARRLDYRDAHAKAGFPTLYRRYVRSACPARVAKLVVARTATLPSATRA